MWARSITTAKCCHRRALVVSSVVLFGKPYERAVDSVGRYEFDGFLCNAAKGAKISAWKTSRKARVYHYGST